MSNLALSSCSIEGEAFSIQQLEGVRLDTHFRTHFGEKLCRYVPDRVVLDGRHCTLWANGCMADTKIKGKVAVYPFRFEFVVNLRTF